VSGCPIVAMLKLKNNLKKQQTQQNMHISGSVSANEFSGKQNNSLKNMFIG
jgi:hypothetical protein